MYVTVSASTSDRLVSLRCLIMDGYYLDNIRNNNIHGCYLDNIHPSICPSSVPDHCCLGKDRQPCTVNHSSLHACFWNSVRLTSIWFNSVHLDSLSFTLIQFNSLQFGSYLFIYVAHVHNKSHFRPLKHSPGASFIKLYVGCFLKVYKSQKWCVSNNK